MAKDQDAQLPDEWTQPRTTARLHLLPAKKKPIVVVLRRKPSRGYHVLQWHTRRHQLTSGSWFRGRLYEGRCDVSWDGRWMVYLAMGSQGETWNGICRPPWLRTVADLPNCGTWAGGGVFTQPRELLANDHWHWDRSLAEFSDDKSMPFKIVHEESGGEDLPSLERRLQRDGWQRAGDFGTERQISLKHTIYSVLHEGDAGWAWRPTAKHPTLRMYYRGYFVGGSTYEFQLEDSALLGLDVDWATWDCLGQLLVSRKGCLEAYGLRDLRKGRPSFRHDLEGLVPPWQDPDRNDDRPGRRDS